MPGLESALVRKLSRFLPLSEAELAVLEQLEAGRRVIAAGTKLVHERQVGHQAYILEEGWACSYKLLSDGSRQVIDFPISGDVVGLRSVFLHAADHGFAAVTDVAVTEISASQLMAAFEQAPRVGIAFMWAASRDEAMVVEHLVNIGRRSALVRTAHFLVELGLRLQGAGMGSATGFACPLNQYLLADALGLTAIHVNRILRRLRERKLLTFRAGKVVFHDLHGLRELARYHSGYLDENEGPR
jgi:CRP-like cAMP-binding protein